MSNISDLLDDYERAQAATAAAKRTLEAAQKAENSIAGKLFALVEPIAIAADRKDYKSLGRPAVESIKREGGEVVVTLGFYAEDEVRPFQEAKVKLQKKDLELASQPDQSDPSTEVKGEQRKVGFRRPGR